MRVLPIIVFLHILSVELVGMDAELSDVVVANDGDNQSDTTGDEDSESDTTSEESPKKQEQEQDVLDQTGKNSQEGSVTLGETAKFLYESQKKDPWDPCSLTGWLWGGFGIGLIFSGVPGMTVAGLYCRNYPHIKNCIDACPKTYTEYNNCYFDCVKQDHQTLDNPICYTGIALSFVPVTQAIIAACAVPIANSLNRRVDNFNHQLDRTINWQFLQQRSENSPLTQEDVKSIAAILLQKNSPLFGKFSVAQALAVAEVNWRGFMRLADDDFSEEASIYAHKLINLYTDKSLAQTLGGGNVQAELKKTPYLLQALVRVLPATTLNNPDVHNALADALKAIQPFIRKQKKKFYKHAIQKISQGESIYSYIVTDDISDGASSREIEVTLKTATHTIKANKKHLIKMSNYFKKVLDENPTKDFIDLSKLDATLVLMLINVLNKDFVVSKDNILTALNTAHHFKIPVLLDRCDQFIATNGLNDKLVLWYLNTQKISTLKPKSCKARVQFCQAYELKKTKILLASDLVKQLNHLTLDQESLLEDAQLFHDQELEQARNVFQDKEFIAKLNDRDFLRWIWLNAKDISMLREHIVDFCAHKEHEALVRSTWAGLPDDLDKAISELNGD